MGFTFGTAITADADFVLVAFAQQMTNLIRQPGAVFPHIQAANQIYRDLVGLGYDPTKIDEKYFKREAVLWVLVQSLADFIASSPAGVKYAGRHGFYISEHAQEKRSRVYVFTNAVKQRRRLPLFGNVDSGFIVGGPASGPGDGFPQIGRSKVANFDKYIQENAQ